MSGAPISDLQGPGPTSRVFFSQRLRLHYVDWGNAGAPPLVLLHGGRDHCRNWDWVAEELRKDWHIIAPDLRGHGDSQWSPDGSYTMAGFLYDLAGEGYPYPVILPAVFDDGRVLGPLLARFAVVVHQGYDLALIVGIQGDQAEVVFAIDAGEILCLLF